MPVTRLYHPDYLRSGETVELDNNASNHLIRVLRTRTNTPVILFNGDGFDYHCTTLNDNAKETLVLVGSKTATGKESTLDITLIQALSRQNRMEFTIQKSIELGVNKIIPVICIRSNTKFSKQQQQKKLAHWRRVAISACEQCGRNIIPEISEMCTIEKLPATLNNQAHKFILNPEADTSLKHIYAAETTTDINKIEICIGPEGGLTSEEIAALENSQFASIRFGPRILRTETAGPAVISALQTLWGDC